MRPLPEGVTWTSPEIWQKVLRLSETTWETVTPVSRFSPRITLRQVVPAAGNLIRHVDSLWHDSCPKRSVSVRQKYLPEAAVIRAPDAFLRGWQQTTGR